MLYGTKLCRCYLFLVPCNGDLMIPCTGYFYSVILRYGHANPGKAFIPGKKRKNKFGLENPISVY